MDPSRRPLKREELVHIGKGTSLNLCEFQYGLVTPGPEPVSRVQ